MADQVSCAALSGFRWTKRPRIIRRSAGSCNAQVEKRLSEAEFPEAIRQIDLKGLILREGATIDATPVEAQVKRSKEPNEGELGRERKLASGRNHYAGRGRRAGF